MSATPRAAAIDIGTNTVLLLVAERRGARLLPLLERATITRLGAGVDATGRLAPEAVARTLACLEDYARELEALGIARLDVVGTSALRDARGGAPFVQGAAARLGVAPRVISGLEEARLSFEGALSGLALEGPGLVVDVGGGSTELVSGDPARPGDVSAVSLDVGSVRLTERLLSRDPPSAEELARVSAAVSAALTQARAPGALGWVVGVAGTVTTLAAVAQGLARYEPARVHGSRLEAAQIAALVERLAALTGAERARVPGLEPQRADVIVAGGLIVQEVLRWAAQPHLVVSDRGVRWGLMQRLLGAGGEERGAEVGA